MKSGNKIAEPAREGFLYQLWLERDLSCTALKTIDGQDLAILEKGVRNFDAGPDFSDALIRYQGQILRGDVEVHPLAGDWYHHGHHQDPRYNSVILHVVTMNCPKDFRTVRQDGAVVPTLNLDAFLEKDAEALQRDDDEDLAIEKLPGSCHLALQPLPTIWQVIRHHSERRLQTHSQQFAELRNSQSWDQIFYVYLLTALGYAKNQLPFKRLAQILPIETIWQYIWNDPPEWAQRKCEAYLFGASGLLEERMGEGAEIEAYRQSLLQLWQEFPERRKIDPLKPELWQFFRLRPANFPTRRIAGAAVIIYRFMEKGFIDTLLQPLRTWEGKPRQCFADWQAKLVVSHHPFWSRYYRFEHTPFRASEGESKIIGEDRSQDIIVNSVIPGLLAYAVEVEDGKLQNLLREAYYHHPRLGGNELTRKMEAKLFPAVKQSPICEYAWQQQGLIQIGKMMCMVGACERCGHPFC